MSIHFEEHVKTFTLTYQNVIVLPYNWFPEVNWRGMEGTNLKLEKMEISTLYLKYIVYIIHLSLLFISLKWVIFVNILNISKMNICQNHCFGFDTFFIIYHFIKQTLIFVFSVFFPTIFLKSNFFDNTLITLNLTIFTKKIFT